MSEMLPTRNHAVDQRDDFLVKGRRSDFPDLVGVLHTHPGDGILEPSNNDILGIPDGLIGVIYKDGEMISYTNRGPAAQAIA